MNVNDTVHLFKRSVKNTLHNFIPHEIITCDDRDPPWIDNSVRHLIQDKAEAYKRFKIGNNNSQNFENFNSFRVRVGFPLKRLTEVLLLWFMEKN